MTIYKETETAIIGAGLTGMALAHQLNKNQKDFHVLERSGDVGGVICTIEKEGFVFELGPNTGIIGNDEVPALFDDLTDLCQIEVAGDSVKKRYVLKNGQWRPLPGGLWQGVTTTLFSVYDKLRILGEPFRSRGTNPNETLDQLVIRRMGKSFLNYAVDPFIIGIYAGDPAYLVPRFALPKLYNLEQNYGSFIGGTIKLGRERKKAGYTTRATRKTFSVQGGLKNLVKALLLSAGKENFSTGITNLKIQALPEGFLIAGRKGDDEIAVKAKKVVTTVGAYELPALMPFVDEKDICTISSLLYAKVVQISLGFKKWEGMPLDGFGGLIPFREHRDILGVLFLSAFFPERAPEGGALLSVFLGGVRRPDVYEMSDAVIRELVEREICGLMKLQAFRPDVFEITRYRHAIPQYGADCEARFETIKKVQQQFPGLFIAGNLRNGIGMADRIKQGIDLAENVMKKE